MGYRTKSPTIKPIGIGSVTVVGRVETPSGRIADHIFEGRVDLEVGHDFEAGQIVQRMADLAKAFSQRQDRALAFVGVGYGPAPIDDSDKQMWKGVFVEALHPRVPKHNPKGGEFCSTDGPENTSASDDPIDGAANQNTVLKDLSSKLAKRETRKTLRRWFIASLRFVGGLTADVIPYVGEVFDGYEIERTIEDGVALERDISAAETYVRNGPQALDDLRASAEDQSFSSAAAFKKEVIGKFYGPAGDGYDYHHIVWQGGPNAQNIPAELLHSTENMVRVPRLLHEEITAEYSKPYEGTGKTLREWLDTQPYDVQRAKGIEVSDLGIIK